MDIDLAAIRILVHFSAHKTNLKASYAPARVGLARTPKMVKIIKKKRIPAHSKLAKSYVLVCFSAPNFDFEASPVLRIIVKRPQIP